MPELPRDEITRRYEGGESAASLGRAYGVAPATIRKRLGEWGVRVRGRSEAAVVRGPVGPDPIRPYRPRPQR